MGNRPTPILYTFVLHPKRLICIRELELRDLDVFLFLLFFFPFFSFPTSSCFCCVKVQCVLDGQISWPWPEDPQVWERKRRIWRTPRPSTWVIPCVEALKLLLLVLLNPPVEQRLVCQQLLQPEKTDKLKKKKMVAAVCFFILTFSSL